MDEFVDAGEDAAKDVQCREHRQTFQLKPRSVVRDSIQMDCPINYLAYGLFTPPSWVKFVKSLECRLVGRKSSQKPRSSEKTCFVLGLKKRVAKDERTLSRSEQSD